MSEGLQFLLIDGEELISPSHSTSSLPGDTGDDTIRSENKEEGPPQRIVLTMPTYLKESKKNGKLKNVKERRKKNLH